VFHSSQAGRDSGLAGGDGLAVAPAIGVLDGQTRCRAKDSHPTIALPNPLAVALSVKTSYELCSWFEQHLDRPLAAGHGRHGEAVRAGVALHRDDPAAAVRHQVERVSGAVDARASGLRVLLNAELHRLCSIAAVRADGVVPAVVPVDVEISGHPDIESGRVAWPGAAVVEQCLRLERCGRWAGRWRRAGRWRDHVKPRRGRGGARGYAC
jgi:hypothetical protein